MSATVTTRIADTHGAETPTPVAVARGHRHPLLTSTVAVGLVGAIATTTLAAAAHAAGVPLSIDGEQIPVLGFAQMTFLGAVLGGFLVAALNRWSSRPRRRFELVAAALTVLSCVPSVTMPPDAATKLTLVATHLLAAAIIVPVLVRRTAR